MLLSAVECRLGGVGAVHKGTVYVISHIYVQYILDYWML